MKNRIIIDFTEDKQAKAFFKLFDGQYTDASFKLISDILTAVDAGCIATTETMPGECYYHIEIE